MQLLSKRMAKSCITLSYIRHVYPTRDSALRKGCSVDDTQVFLAALSTLYMVSVVWGGLHKGARGEYEPANLRAR